MAVGKTFSSYEQVKRLWSFIDTLARRAWERDGTSNEQKQSLNKAAGTFYQELLNASRDLPAEDTVDKTIPPRGLNVDDQNWGQFSLNEFTAMVGRQDVQSITDAYLKATSLLQVLDSRHQGYVFRGHRDISWPLIPRKGRELRDRDGWEPPDKYLDNNRLTQVLPEELTALSEFQNKWNNLENVDEIDRSKNIVEDNPEWWFRMQHYDDGDGTRLLDVTTSINAALLFACVNWSTGELDENQDGVLYLWSVGENANKDDFLIKSLPQKAADLFTGYPDAPVFILNPPHNERSKAQSGAFYWWPKFWEGPPYNAPYYLRIPKTAKKNIASDLLKLGFGPKDAVRGKQGLKNEKILRHQLGFPDWNPMELR